MSITLGSGVDSVEHTATAYSTPVRQLFPRRRVAVKVRTEAGTVPMRKLSFKYSRLQDTMAYTRENAHHKPNNPSHTHAQNTSQRRPNTSRPTQRSHAPSPPQTHDGSYTTDAALPIAHPTSRPHKAGAWPGATLTKVASGCPASTGCYRIAGCCRSPTRCRTHQQPSHYTTAHEAARAATSQAAAKQQPPINQSDIKQ